MGSGGRFAGPGGWKMANGIETRENHLVWNHRTSTTLGLLHKNKRTDRNIDKSPPLFPRLLTLQGRYLLNRCLDPWMHRKFGSNCEKRWWLWWWDIAHICSFHRKQIHKKLMTKSWKRSLKRDQIDMSSFICSKVLSITCGTIKKRETSVASKKRSKFP